MPAFGREPPSVIGNRVTGRLGAGIGKVPVQQARCDAWTEATETPLPRAPERQLIGAILWGNPSVGSLLPRC
jgi:hypothetical protein